MSGSNPLAIIRRVPNNNGPVLPKSNSLFYHLLTQHSTDQLQSGTVHNCNIHMEKQTKNNKTKFKTMK